MKPFVLILTAFTFGMTASAQEPPTPKGETQTSLKKLGVELSAAQKAEDEAEVRRLTKRAIEVLSDQAGIPEIADQFREVPKNAKPLAADEMATAFDPYIEFIEKQKWWKVGLDPTKTNHLPRELATIIEGCLAARSVSEANAERPLKIGDELGGHIVTGHVDGVAELADLRPEGESVRMTFAAPPDLVRFIAPKGSVCLDGTSLTVNEVEGLEFGVNLIAHTLKVTSGASRGPVSR